MRIILQSFKNLIVALFWFCSTYALFAFIAHFTEIQSFLLAFVAVFAVDGYRRRALKGLQ